jgi:hypothetical protein
LAFDVSGCPPSDNLFLRFPKLSSFMANAMNSDSIEGIRLDSPAFIEFEGYSGARIEIQFSKSKDDGKLRLTFEPKYASGIHRFELTRPRLKALEIGLRSRNEPGRLATIQSLKRLVDVLHMRPLEFQIGASAGALDLLLVDGR